MVKEILGYLNLKPGNIIVDATMGTGGHSKAIFEQILPSGKLIGIDRDEFWRVANGFRNKDIWKQNGDGQWELKWGPE